MISEKNEKPRGKQKNNMSRNAKKIFNVLKEHRNSEKFINNGIPGFPNQDASLKSLVDILKESDKDVIYSIIDNTSFFPKEYDDLKKEIIEKNDEIRELYSERYHNLDETDKKVSETKETKKDDLYDMLNLYNKVLKYSTGNYRNDINPMKAAKEIKLLNSTLDELNKQSKEFGKEFLESVKEYIVPEYQGFEDYYPGFLRVLNEDIKQINDKYENSKDITKKFFETLKKYSGDDELIIGNAVLRALKKENDKDENKKTLDTLLNVLNKESVLNTRASFGGLEWRNKLKQRFEEAEENDLYNYDVGNSFNNLFDNIDKYIKIDNDRKTNILKKYISRFKGVLKEMEEAKETEIVKKIKPNERTLQEDSDRKKYLSYLSDIVINLSSSLERWELYSEVDSLTESAIKYRGEKLEKFLKTMDKISEFGYGVEVFSNTARTKDGKDFDVYLDDVVNFLEQFKGSIDKSILSEKEINGIIKGFKNKREKNKYRKALEEVVKNNPGNKEVFKKVARAPLSGIFGKEFKEKIYNNVKKKNFENIEYSFLPEEYKNVINVDDYIEEVLEFAREFKNPKTRDSYVANMKNIIKKRSDFISEYILKQPEKSRFIYFSYIKDLNNAFKSFKNEGATEKQIVEATRAFYNNVNSGWINNKGRKFDHHYGINNIVIPAMESLKNYFRNPKEIWNAGGIENLIGTYLKETQKLPFNKFIKDEKMDLLKSLLRKAEKMPSKYYLSYLKTLEKTINKYSPSEYHLSEIDSNINYFLSEGEYKKINSYIRKYMKEIKGYLY